MHIQLLFPPFDVFKCQLASVLSLPSMFLFGFSHLVVQPAKQYINCPRLLFEMFDKVFPFLVTYSSTNFFNFFPFIFFKLCSILCLYPAKFNLFVMDLTFPSLWCWLKWGSFRIKVTIATITFLDFTLSNRHGHPWIAEIGISLNSGWFAEV